MDVEHSGLLKELTQGMHLAHQLLNNLSSSSSSSSSHHHHHTTLHLLTDQILSSSQKALSLLNWAPPGSPLTTDQDQPHAFKKRKTSTKCGDQVKVCSESSLEGDDAFSWRKYGQKDILASKHPRGYYRCTHRLTGGCLATKQVQRSDNDPTIFEVTYRGRHTCKQTYETRAPPESTTRSATDDDDDDSTYKEKSIKKNDDDDVQVINQQSCDEEKQKQPEEVLLGFGSADSVSWEDICFTFPNPKTKPEDMIMRNEDISFNQNAVLLNETSLNSSFMSTGTSHQCNYFSVSTPSSVTNSPFSGLDFHLAELEFDSDFPFDDPHLFC